MCLRTDPIYNEIVYIPLRYRTKKVHRKNIKSWLNVHVFGVCQQQMRRTALLLFVFKALYLDMIQAKFQFNSSFCVAEETGLSLALSESPKTDFVASWPKSLSQHVTKS